MLKYQWSVPTDATLRPRHEERLSEFYHENSKLSLARARESAAEFQFSPFELYLASRSFKQFRNAPRIALPEVVLSTEPLQEILRRRRSSRDLTGSFNLLELSTLLRQSLGPTAVFHNSDHEVDQALRAWPSAGGLYPLDTYVIASRVENVDPGLYHYNPIASELELLPARPAEAILRDGFFWQQFIVTAAAVLLLVAVFPRTTAKYGERGYRLILLDAGHACQNLLLTAEQLHLGAVAVGGFNDDSLAADLAIDGISEAVIHTVALGRLHE
jgi:SagB-type dehydrogenase family enzyme